MAVLPLKEIDKLLRKQYPILCDDVKPNTSVISNAPSILKTDKYKVYAHNMRFFKEFNHLTRPSKDPLINDNLKNEMKF